MYNNLNTFNFKWDTKMKKIIIPIILVLLSLASVLGADYNITSCQQLTSNNNYYLTQDIINNASTNCFWLITSDEYITLDCQGHVVDGVDGASTYGFRTLIDTYGNLKIRNCIFTDWEYGVWLRGGSWQQTPFNAFWNITANSNKYGFYQQSGNYPINYTNIMTNNNTDTGFWLEGTCGFACKEYIFNLTSNFNDKGFRLLNKGYAVNMTNSSFIGNANGTHFTNVGAEGSPHNLYFYNNIFRNTGNFIDAVSNRTSIIFDNGTSRGNYWTNMARNGFSDTCTDTTPDDGICDSAYVLLSPNVDDAYPLSDCPQNIILYSNVSSCHNSTHYKTTATYKDLNYCINDSTVITYIPLVYNLTQTFNDCSNSTSIRHNFIYNDTSNCSYSILNYTYENCDIFYSCSGGSCYYSGFCGDSTCQTGEGENQTNCCVDCGCPQFYRCSSNVCTLKSTEKTITETGQGIGYFLNTITMPLATFIFAVGTVLIFALAIFGSIFKGIADKTKGG